MPSSGDAICTAKPPRAELVTAAIVYLIAAAMVALFGAMGLDALLGDFLTEDHATNRWKMAAIFVPALVLLSVATYRANRLRFYRLFDDRLEVGRHGEVRIALADVRRVRVGAPVPAAVQTVRRANELIGKIKAANANAARMLDRQYALTVVLDVSERERQVINLSTVDRGEALLDELLTRLAPKVESPPRYSDEELTAFGRFVPRRYIV